MQPWHERHPERLAEERQALLAFGATVHAVADESDDGLIRWIVSIPVSSLGLPDGHPLPDPLRLNVVFPDSFPYMRPEVATLDPFLLQRHHHPFGRNLCLLPRRTFYWDSDTLLANHLREQLPLLVARAAGAENPAILEMEGEQAEPYTDYYEYLQPAAVFVPTEIDVYEFPERGVLQVSAPRGIDGGIQVVVRGVETPTGAISPDLPESLGRQFPKKGRVPFVRLADPLDAPNGQHGLARLAEIGKPLKLARVLSTKKGELKLGAVLFPEESVAGGTTGWLFIARWRSSGHRRKRAAPEKAHYVRAQRIGRTALLARKSGLSELGSKTIALVGLGALGAPIALGLARAGAGLLRLLDRDVVDAGTVMRWPLGFPSVGHSKTDVLKHIIEAHYPYTSVTAVQRRLGSTFSDGEPEHLVLGQFLEGADILVDAAAEWGVSHLLADLAREFRIPYARVFATAGAWGGEVSIIHPESDACWGCVYEAQKDGLMMFPSTAPSHEGEVQPTGCPDPTFTGAGFELDPISSEAVRMVVSSLLGPDGGSYPALPWQVAVLSLRDEEGRLIPPTWHTYPLKRHPRCPAHAD